MNAKLAMDTFSESFIHRRLFGAAKGAAGSLVTGGNPFVGAIQGFTAFGKPGGAPCGSGRVRGTDGHCHEHKVHGTGGARFPCGNGMVRNAAGDCVAPTIASQGFNLPDFIDTSGPATTPGQRGSGSSPFTATRSIRSCGPGMVLGKDGLCYASSGKGSIANRDREWPKGRRPLGTPGELRALATAAAFGRRMEKTVKRMQKIGVLSKPRRSVRQAPAMKRLAPGGTSIINVE